MNTIEIAKDGIKIGKYLKKLRMNLDYTRAAVAAEIGISTKTYGKMERDEISISLETLKNLIKYYNIDVKNIDIEKFIKEGRLVEQNGNTLDNGSKQLEININTKEELVLQLKERIEDNKKIEILQKERINELEKANKEKEIKIKD